LFISTTLLLDETWPRLLLPRLSGEKFNDDASVKHSFRSLLPFIEIVSDAMKTVEGAGF
jgi:hypothetical protein